MVTTRAAITVSEARKIAKAVKAEGVTARIRLPGGAIVEIVPAIPDPHRDAAVDAAREIDLG